MTRAALTMCLLWLPTAARADCNLTDAIGYTIAAEKTVTGWIEDGKRQDGFEGCSYGRILVFQDGTGLTCNGYSYSYSYNPRAVLLVNNYRQIKACINGVWFDLRPLN